MLADSCLPLQGALLLLRQLSAATPNYTSRILPPSITKKALATFDRDIIRVLEQRLGRSLQCESALQKVSLPNRFGGLGLATAKEHATGAFVAGMAASTASVKHAIWDKYGMDTKQVSNTSSQTALRNALLTLRSSGAFASSKLLGEDHASFIKAHTEEPTSSRRLQGKIANKLADVTWASLHTCPALRHPTKLARSPSSSPSLPRGCVCRP